MQKSATSQVMSSSTEQNVLANQEHTSQATLAPLFEQLGSSERGLITQEAPRKRSFTPVGLSNLSLHIRWCCSSSVQQVIPYAVAQAFLWRSRRFWLFVLA